MPHCETAIEFESEISLLMPKSEILKTFSQLDFTIRMFLETTRSSLGYWQTALTEPDKEALLGSDVSVNDVLAVNVLESIEQLVGAGDLLINRHLLVLSDKFLVQVGKQVVLEKQIRKASELNR